MATVLVNAAGVVSARTAMDRIVERTESAHTWSDEVVAARLGGMTQQLLHPSARQKQAGEEHRARIPHIRPPKQ